MKDGDAVHGLQLTRSKALLVSVISREVSDRRQ